MRTDLFLSLPAPTVLLLLSSLLDLTQAESPAQPTKTLEYRVLNVVSYPPQPTPPPPTNVFQYRALRHRQQRNSTNPNTICGYIGGDLKLPATCSLGSHCVMDTEHKVMGCCPDGAAQCTAGVFTGCVDFRSGPQTIVNPYVYTCSNGDVCYQNAFAGGYSQYGCGSKTGLGTTVVASATGLGVGAVPTSGAKPPSPAPGASKGAESLDIPTMKVSFTAKLATVATPITISNERSLSISTSTSSASSASSPPASSVSSGASSSDSPSSTSTGTTTSSASKSPVPPPSTTSSSSSSTTGPSAGAGSASTDPTTSQTNKPDQTGVIVGSTISGVAGLVAIVAAAIFILQRRNRNKRTGPGLNGDSTYISPMSHGPNFQPIASDHNAYNGGTHSPPGGYAYPGQHPALYGDGAHGTQGPTMSGAATGHHFPTAAVAGGAAAGMAGAGAAHYAYGYTDDNYENYDGTMGTHMSSTEHLPLTAGALAGVGTQGELDDFSTGFHRALSRIGEEEYDDDDERADLGTARPNVGAGNMAGTGTMASPGNVVSPLDDDSPARPIWQQQRRRSSNTMWL